MRAITVSEFGGPEVLRPGEVPMPGPGPDDALVRGRQLAGVRRPAERSRLIRMAPWFDDGLLSVQVAARYYYEDAASAHRRVEEGPTRGKLVLVVDDDLAPEWEV